MSFFFPRMGTLSILSKVRGSGLPLGGRMGIWWSPTARVLCRMKASASVSSSKKSWINLVSARNLVPMTLAGMASAIFLPSMEAVIRWRSRKAEVGSVAGGILVDGGRSSKLLWVFSQLKISKTPWNLGLSDMLVVGSELSLSASIGVLVDA